MDKLSEALIVHFPENVLLIFLESSALEFRACQAGLLNKGRQDFYVLFGKSA